MELKVKDHNKTKIFQLVGSLDIYTASKVKKEITQIIDDEEAESVVLDMSNVNHMDSSGIALLANIQKKMKSSGNKFGLLAPTNDIMAVLKLSSLDSFFTIYNTEAEIR
ncbi:MAG TPA: STAS domain-containing protein [Leptospiraceae bacterium]|nr:STAS domain-containing protein [Leptospiraceae bacterium]HMW07416.1 STAS domain-containing protein [Leptospiraceae bacterium]HMX34690.1 STAS domain-containing protein [Leptospiraceae bacterium]HMY32995.1 STAS domain-containing protein [Leptospiraceae bacterium]HMZ63547.1 STAS domain-containing protein [Leptospiraceae bacterium]